MNILVVGIGGFLGAIARYGLNHVVDRRHGHLVATLVINVGGCLLLGMLAAAMHRRIITSEPTRLLVQVGFLSSFTTFSTFGLANFELLRDGRAGVAVLNIATQLLLGIGAAAIGWFIVRAA